MGSAMFLICSCRRADSHDAALPPVRGRPIAQPREGGANVRSWRGKRVRSRSMAAHGWQTGVSGLRLRDLLRLSSLAGDDPLALQGVSRRLLADVRYVVRLAQAAAENLPDGHRGVLQRSEGQEHARLLPGSRRAI